jgi:hypothetical protein
MHNYSYLKPPSKSAAISLLTLAFLSAGLAVEGERMVTVPITG